MPEIANTAAAASAYLGKAKTEYQMAEAKFNYMRGVTENASRVLETVKKQIDLRMEYQFIQNKLKELAVQEAEIKLRESAPSSNNDIRAQNMSEDSRRKQDIAAEKYNLESRLSILQTEIIRKGDIYSLLEFVEGAFNSYPAINSSEGGGTDGVQSNG